MSRSPRCALALGTAVIMALTLSACSSLFGSRTQSTKLTVGQCVLVPIGTQVDSVTTTECTEEHTGEIYSITAIDRQALPSRDEMDDLSSTPATTPRAYVARLPRKRRSITPLSRRPRRPGPPVTATLSASLFRLGMTN